MQFPTLSRVVSGLFISTLVLSGCGGDGGRKPASSGNNGPVGSAAIIRGVVTQAPANNVITLAGRTIGTSSATVTENGTAGSNNANAGIGMTVTALVGADNSAQAIDVAIVVQGPINTIDTATRTITTLGQTITYTPTTVFNGTSETTLAAGQVIKISGSATAGGFTATRIDFVAASFVAGTQLQVTGAVQNLDIGVSTFTLGTLVVNYAAAPALNPPLANGMNVAVGATTLPVANVFTATELAALTANPTNPTNPGTPTPITVSGAIASVAVNGEFVVMGQRIRANASTRFVNGSATNILAGANVTVVGTMDATDTTLLNATDVTFAAAAVNGEAEIKGPIEAVDAAAGTLTVLGIAVKMDATTLIASEDDPDDTPVTLADLQVGDFVEINGTVNGTTVTATAIELDDDDGDEVKLTAQVASVGANELMMLNVKIATTSSTEPQVSADDDDSTDLASFFATVKAGDIVEAEGTYANGVLTADELEISGADDDAEDDD